jgi:hypothetical protein
MYLLQPFLQIMRLCCTLQITPKSRQALTGPDPEAGLPVWPHSGFSENASVQRCKLASIFLCNTTTNSLDILYIHYGHMGLSFASEEIPQILLYMLTQALTKPLRSQRPNKQST